MISNYVNNIYIFSLFAYLYETKTVIFQSSGTILFGTLNGSTYTHKYL